MITKFWLSSILLNNFLKSKGIRFFSKMLSPSAKTMDGIKFSTRAQAGRCHGSFCTTRLMKILSEETNTPLVKVTKRGLGSEIVKKDRLSD